MQVQFKNVYKQYETIDKKNQDFALKEVNFDIEKKDIIFILGKTGSGKTTITKLIDALIFATKGQINIFDYSINNKEHKNKKINNLRKNIGYLFQFPEYQLFESTVYKDIIFGANNFGVDKESINDTINKLLDDLNISDLKDKSPFDLSEGQMKKVAIASILVYDPNLIILDEPTKSLDPKSSIDIMEYFKNIYDTKNKTLIVISHDLNVFYKYATRMILVDNGSIVYDGDKVEFYKNKLDTIYDLKKPDVLDIIDDLNNNLNLTLDYDIFDIDELYIRLKDVLS